MIIKCSTNMSSASLYTATDYKTVRTYISLRPLQHFYLHFFDKILKTSHLLATRKAGHKRQCCYVSAVLCLCAYQSSGTSLWLIHKRISGEEEAKT